MLRTGLLVLCLCWCTVLAAGGGVVIPLYGPVASNPHYFLGRLFAGTPPQQLSVLVDARSSDVLLVSSSLIRQAGFDANRSGTFAFRGGASAPPVRFGEGQMFIGRLATDDFAAAVGAEKPLVFFFADDCQMNGDDDSKEGDERTSQRGLDHAHQCDFLSVFSGVIGLGPGPTQGGEQRLVSQMGVEDVAGLWYSSKNQTGVLTVGFFNSTFAKSEPAYIPFEKDGRALFQDFVVNFPNGTGFTMHALPFVTDCGNSNVVLNGLPGLDVNVEPDCSNFASLPTVTIAPVSQVRIVLTPYSYVVRSNPSNCTSYLRASSKSHPFFAVGVPFLRQAFTVFDFSHNQIGFSYPIA